MARVGTIRKPNEAVLPDRAERQSLAVQAFRLYRTDVVFRGLIDLAVVGALVLAAQSDWSNLTNTVSGWFSSTNSSVTGRPSAPTEARMHRIIGQGPGEQTIAAIGVPRIDPQTISQVGEPLSAQLAAIAGALEDNQVDRAWGLASVLDDRVPAVAYAKAVVTLRRPGIGRTVEARKLLRSATAEAVYPAYILMGEVLLKLVQLEEAGRLPTAERIAIDDLGKTHPASHAELAAEAAKWWERAASFGRPQGLRLLGMAKARGLSGTVDLVGAAAVWREAARSGDALAQFELAQLLRTGTGLQADLDEAIRLYRLSAESLPFARLALATALTSKAIAGDLRAAEEAMTNLELVADLPASRKTRAVSSYLLGQYHLQIAPGPMRSPRRALAAFERSVRLGSERAAYAAGQAYRTGVGTAPNPVCAYAFYRLARAVAPERIDPLLDHLAGELGSTQVELAVRVSRILASQNSAGNAGPARISSLSPSKSTKVSDHAEMSCQQIIERSHLSGSSGKAQL